MRNRMIFVLVPASLALAAAVAWATAPAGKFTTAPDTVVDTQTQLTWQRSVGNTKVTWKQAFDACDALDLDGKTDWRLPELQEVYSLIDFSKAGLNPYIDAAVFPDTPWGVYWSNTSGPGWGSAKNRYTVSFGGNSGPTIAQTPGDSPVAFVRCVR